MTFLQMAILSTVLLIAFVYFGGKKFSLRLVRNIAGGLGVIAGLTWHGALGLAEAGLIYKMVFLIAGYLLAVGLMRVRGVQ
ncbi:MAG: hypothetical protein L3J36_14560 [Rhodobacteraceae bacterium]|nr:hypothetical protein [Paracoccaceae bacterium]